ncbi:uncharacterized protein METZ01_LOCUS296543, partial [marine metagenome]
MFFFVVVFIDLECTVVQPGSMFGCFFGLTPFFNHIRSDFMQSF